MGGWGGGGANHSSKKKSLLSAQDTQSSIKFEPLNQITGNRAHYQLRYFLEVNPNQYVHLPDVNEQLVTQSYLVICKT